MVYPRTLERIFLINLEERSLVPIPTSLEKCFLEFDNGFHSFNWYLLLSYHVLIILQGVNHRETSTENTLNTKLN